MSENKTGKYLKYAIGEIVLVVIGILIALQINTWNQKRLNSDLEKEYINRLTEDLKEDKAIIDAVIKYKMQVKLHAKNAVKVFENSSDKNPNSLDNLIDLYQASQLSDPSGAMSTYKELISSGQINLLKNKGLKTDIIRYFEWNWSETTVLQLPNHYRDNLRGKMPDDIQTEIRENCDDIYVKIRKSIEVQLPTYCTINLDEAYALTVVNKLGADESLKKDLRLLLSNLEATIKSLNSAKDEISNVLYQLESNGYD